MKDIKDTIGHSEIKMTDRYTHLPDAKKVALQEKLAYRYSNGTSSTDDSVEYWWEGATRGTHREHLAIF